MERSTITEALVEDWEADIQTYLLLLDNEPLTLLEKAAIISLIEKATRKINDHDS